MGRCGVSLPDPDWVRRSIRPPARGNHEYIDWRSANELWIQHDGRLGQICTPDGAVHEWSEKHQVSHPVVVVATGIRNAVREGLPTIGELTNDDSKVW